MKKLIKKKGLTLNELLVVIIILAVLSAIIIPQLDIFSDGANKSACRANQRRLDSATDVWYAHDKANLKKEPTVDGLVTEGFISGPVSCPGGGNYKYNKATSMFECSDRSHSRSG